MQIQRNELKSIEWIKLFLSACLQHFNAFTGILWILWEKLRCLIKVPAMTEAVEKMRKSDE